MRRVILVIVVVVFVIAVLGPVILGFGVRAAPPQADDAATLMQKKLANAQKVLEGIAMADLDKVGEHARAMSDLSRQAGFKVFPTAQYEMHAVEFRRALDDMQKGARANNLDAVTLAYVDMTMSCVRCHKHVREVRIGRAGADRSAGSGL
ncbi:MAG TPA: hypothetical protein VGF55_07500 [Gemmataceae bacterium]|jgi:cytochrome c556